MKKVSLKPSKFSISDEKMKQHFVTNVGALAVKLDEFYDFLTQEALKNTSAYPLRMNLEINFRVSGYRRPTEYWNFIIYPRKDSRQFLPKFFINTSASRVDYPLYLHDYDILGVPADGNCAFTALKVASKDSKFITEFNLAPN